MRIRTYLAVLAEPPMTELFIISYFAWTALLLGGHQMHGSVQPAVDQTGIHAILQSGWSWFLMLVAMMTPMLADAFRHLWVRSLPRRRWRAIAAFALAYTTIWMLAGAVLTAFADQLKTLPNGGWPAAPAIALLAAVIWQATPWKQVSLNHCHLRPRLSAFGLAADRDSFRFGVVKGFWCAGSCWAFMLLPLVFGQAELLVMLVVSLILISEQYQPARRVGWRISL